jgi:ribosome-associated protein
LPSRSFDDARALALRIAEVISDTPAAKTRVLDIHAVSPFADFFVICSGDNERQLRAITREVTEKLATAGVRPERSEGTAVAGWILLDFGEVIVHVFGAEQRAYYRLEQLWSEAPTLLAIE